MICDGDKISIQHVTLLFVLCGIGMHPAKYPNSHFFRSNRRFCDDGRGLVSPVIAD
jgi:hypothetical protein